MRKWSNFLGKAWDFWGGVAKNPGAAWGTARDYWSGVADDPSAVWDVARVGTGLGGGASEVLKERVTPGAVQESLSGIAKSVANNPTDAEKLGRKIADKTVNAAKGFADGGDASSLGLFSGSGKMQGFANGVMNSVLDEAAKAPNLGTAAGMAFQLRGGKGLGATLGWGMDRGLKDLSFENLGAGLDDFRADMTKTSEFNLEKSLDDLPVYNIPRNVFDEMGNQFKGSPAAQGAGKDVANTANMMADTAMSQGWEGLKSGLKNIEWHKYLPPWMNPTADLPTGDENAGTT